MPNDELEDFSDEVTSASEYEAKLPGERKFLGWHLPRKQFVRHWQWCDQIWRLLDDYPRRNGLLKYLGLPGVDLLDLRHFHSEVCVPRNLHLQFLGFNSSAKPGNQTQIEMNVSLDEVKKLSHVDPISHILGDDISLVADQRSLAYTKVADMGPYDVINLDLCDGFGSEPPTSQGLDYYKATTQLLSIQAKANLPWVLLLTTRVDSPCVDVELLEVLITKYLQNMETCEAFLRASQSSFQIESEPSLREATQTAKGLMCVLLTGLCKWLTAYVHSLAPVTTLELKSVVGYRVTRDAEVVDLVSIALRFSPSTLVPPDPMGLASTSATPPDEGKVAVDSLKRVAKIKDVDAVLRDDPDLMQTVVGASANLLTLARYDRDRYLQWVASGCPV
jgi:hypothetical protein